jgi:signal peptidase I
LPDATTKSPQQLRFALAEELLRTHGEMRFIAQGASMLPTILPGDELLVRRASLAELAPGDLVLFHRNRRWFAHRVRHIQSNGRQLCLIARGDALTKDDPLVFPEDLLGRVTHSVRYSEPRPIAGHQPAFARIVGMAIRHVPHVAGLYVRCVRLCTRLALLLGPGTRHTGAGPKPVSYNNRKITEAA